MKVTPEHQKEMAELYKEGFTLAELQKQFGYSQPTISKYIREEHGKYAVRSVGRKKKKKKRPIFNKSQVSIPKPTKPPSIEGKLFEEKNVI